MKKSLVHTTSLFLLFPKTQQSFSYPTIILLLFGMRRRWVSTFVDFSLKSGLMM